MIIRLVPIGNSKGVRLPKAILQAAGIEDEVTLRLSEGALVIAPVRKRRKRRRSAKPRQGWAQAFAKMHAAGDDRLLDEKDAHAITPVDEEEWTW